MLYQPMKETLSIVIDVEQHLERKIIFRSFSKLPVYPNRLGPDCSEILFNFYQTILLKLLRCLDMLLKKAKAQKRKVNLMLSQKLKKKKSF